MVRAFRPLGIALIALPSVVSAQTAPVTQTSETPPAPELADAETDGAEIVVTARKREERLEDVPLSILVIGSETIDRANLDNISDLATQTPGFSFK